MNSTSDKYSDWEYRNIALAVVIQCAQLVDSLANTGRADSAQVDACLAPLLVLNPKNNAEIYPDVKRFSSGLNALQKSLERNGLKEFGEPIRYVLGMTVLQQQLGKVSTMQALIRRRIQNMTSMQESVINTNASGESLLEVSSEYDYAALAALYQDTISKLTFRIHVKGNVDHLQNPRVANKIRALLFAGIRSAMLWQQLGGRRWHLFFYKARIRESVVNVRRSLMTVH